MSDKKYFLRYRNTFIGWFEEANSRLHYTPSRPGANSIPSGLGYPIGLFPVILSGNRLQPNPEYAPQHADIIHWLSDRVFPENRQGSHALLANLGLTRYDVWEIAKLTHAAVLTDNYWMSDDLSDRYEDTHLKFKMRRVLPHVRKSGLSAKFVKAHYRTVGPAGKAAWKEIERSFDELSPAVEAE
ncbi:hypothetical protein [Cohnella soli]|uniref:Uncharacterized protein n=1 Tax=Cohnella soli TaxID=425005 RepID=A0ABW0HRZ8_9BACL